MGDENEDAHAVPAAGDADGSDGELPAREPEPFADAFPFRYAHTWAFRHADPNSRALAGAYPYARAYFYADPIADPGADA